jgi:hypothetical protein
VSALENDTEKERVINQLQRQVEEQRAKNKEKEMQFKARVGQFSQEENSAKSKLDTLDKQFHAAPHLDEDFKNRVGMIRGVQDNIVKSLDQIQNNTASLLQDQEKGLMRAFRARLTALTRELETQQSKKGDYSAELQARHRRVLTELHLSQTYAQDFDKKNQKLKADNTKLQEKLRTREDDRQGLMREVMGVQREVARLKQIELKLAKKDDGKSEGPKQQHSAKEIDQARMQSTDNPSFNKELKYREATKRLKRACEQGELESRALQRQLQQMYAETHQLTTSLRTAVDEVKSEVARRRQGPAGTAPAGGIVVDTSVSIHEFTQQDRERVMELLLSDPQVVQLLYSPLNTEEQRETSEDWVNEMFGSKARPSGSLRSFHS